MGRKLIAGENDLATTHPDLALEWDFERNAPLTPQEFMAGSGHKAFWICSQGHSFSSKILHRKAGVGCPVCAGQKAWAGFNDLATTHPDLAAEWDFERNTPLSPQEVMAGSKQKVYWLCPEGHSYQRVVYERKSGSGCLFCSGRTLVSGVNDLATTHPALASEWDFERNAPLTPQEVMAGSDKKAFWRCPNGHSYKAPVAKRKIGRKCPVCSSQKVLTGFNDLATKNPDLALEWDFERNAPLTPQEVALQSKKSVYWLCPEGHSYKATISNRGKEAGTACPYCAGKKPLAGVNDLATTHPDLAAEWDFERNAPLTPQEVITGSGKPFFWHCPNGHSYKRKIGDRKSGYGCPFCSGKAVLTGFNDLATTHPDLAAEWDFERNAPLKPEMVSSGVARKVFWRCSNGHGYEATVLSRAGAKTACPICSGRQVLAGFNDLATTHPDLALEWDFERNAPLTPQEVSAGMGKRVYWVCSNGHSYQAVLLNRSNQQSGCPKCANYGYDATQAGLFYFISNQTLMARKVGITNPERKSNRLLGYGSEWSVVKTYSNENGLLIRDLETHILRWLRKELELPPYLGKQEMGKSGGQSETFAMEGPTDYEVIVKIEKTFAHLIETKKYL